MAFSPEKRNKSLFGEGRNSPEKQLPLWENTLRKAQEREQAAWGELLPNLKRVPWSSWVKAGAGLALFLGGAAMKWKEMPAEFSMKLGRSILENLFKKGTPKQK